jgi:hypothetical protein
LFKDTIRLQKDLPKAMGLLRVIGGMDTILSNAIGSGTSFGLWWIFTGRFSRAISFMSRS